MKRYWITVDDRTGPTVQEASDGLWVRYLDAVEALAEQRKICADAFCARCMHAIYFGITCDGPNTRCKHRVAILHAGEES
jgi:hypothetical protein